MAFHDRLKQARKNAGMTQEDAAKLLGVAKSTYSGYETGKSEPSMKAIADMMRFFAVSADWLWQDETAEQFENERPNPPARPSITDRNYGRQFECIGVEEKELLTLYRSMNETGKSLMMSTARMFAGNPTVQLSSYQSAAAIARQRANDADQKSVEAENSEARA